MQAAKCLAAVCLFAENQTYEQGSRPRKFQVGSPLVRLGVMPAKVLESDGMCFVMTDKMAPAGV